MTDVFISYARSDQAEAERLAERLKALGLSVWYDHGLTPGLDYAREIMGKLNQAAAIVVCWSAASLRSRWVFAEAMAGLHRDNIVPIALDETVAPTPFATLQAIPMQRWAGRYGHPGWRTLLERLSALTGKPELAAKDAAYAQQRRPGKALVVAFDGLWQTLETIRPSNAALLRRVIARIDVDKRQQMLRYISGAGFLQARGFLSGFFGSAGPDDTASMLEAYLFLIDNFDPGDRIYVFGSGTAGISARRLCALIGSCGILRPDYVQKMYDAVRLASAKNKEAEVAHFRALFSVPLENEDLPEGAAPVAFLGLWDSVAIRGASSAGLGRRAPVSPALSSNVRAARFATAIDEKRLAFPLYGIDNLAQLDAASGAHGKFRQVWFPGRVNDMIGDGSSPHFVEPFLWVLEGAEEAGLDVDRSSEALLEIQNLRNDLDPSAPMPKQTMLSMLTPALYPLRPRHGPGDISEVSPGAVARWRHNRNYRPTSLRRVRRALSAPPAEIDDDA